MTYDNILKALGTDNSGNSGLSYEEQAQNYSIFSDLMKKGVKLQDLIDKANAPREPAVDSGVFAVMEQAVSSNSDVKSAKSAYLAIGNQILQKICMQDPEYSQKYSEYRNTVMRIYSEQKDKKRSSEGNRKETAHTGDEDQ